LKFVGDAKKDACNGDQANKCERECQQQQRQANDTYQPCGSENQAQNAYHQ
jgi:hypothetical protein